MFSRSRRSVLTVDNELYNQPGDTWGGDDGFLRVLRPGGVYLYDTINRTLLSKLVAIKLLQEWRWSRLAPPNLHAWDMFVKPEELRILLERHGLEQQDLIGMRPAANALTLLALL